MLRPLSSSHGNEAVFSSYPHEKRTTQTFLATAIPFLLLGGLIAATGAFFAVSAQRLAWTQNAYPKGAIITAASAGIASCLLIISAVALAILLGGSYCCLKGVFKRSAA